MNQFDGFISSTMICKQNMQQICCFLWVLWW